jgi:hypothetical protein
MELLTRLRHAGLTVTRNGDQIVVAPRDLLTDELRAAIREAKPQLLSALEPTQRTVEHEFCGQAHIGLISTDLSAMQESARREVLAQLVTHPHVNRAFVNRFEPDGTMIVTLAIWGVGAGELKIPAERFSQASPHDYAVLLRCMAGNA